MARGKRSATTNRVEPYKHPEVDSPKQYQAELAGLDVIAVKVIDGRGN